MVTRISAKNLLKNENGKCLAEKNVHIFSLTVPSRIVNQPSDILVLRRNVCILLFLRKKF